MFDFGGFCLYVVEKLFQGFIFGIFFDPYGLRRPIVGPYEIPVVQLIGALDNGAAQIRLDLIHDKRSVCRVVFQMSLTPDEAPAASAVFQWLPGLPVAWRVPAPWPGKSDLLCRPCCKAPRWSVCHRIFAKSRPGEKHQPQCQGNSK